VALYFKKYIETKQLGSAEILDLKEYNFPLFEERLKYLSSPSSAVLDFAHRIRSSDGIIIVTPEYNGGYPASLKNVIDLLYDEWNHKPIAISTVSDGPFGGTQVITSLQFSLWKMRALTIPSMFPVIRVQDAFDEDGNPKDPSASEKRAVNFLNELFLYIRAKTT
jgi:NAD(P)H-dependent FMN reductase